MLQHSDGILVRSGIVRQREAVQVKVVRFLVFRTTARIQKVAGRSENGQQAPAQLSRKLRLQSDQVFARGGEIRLPQHPVSFRVCVFQRHQQMVALPQEMPGHNAAHV